MNRSALCSLAILTGLVVVPALPAPARAGDPGTCQGLAVTITGTPGETLDGTDGDDVIATNGATQVHALGGDDTICVTGTPTADSAEVYAGAGDDAVQALGRLGTFTYLGSGADTFVGGPGSDFVAAGVGPGRADAEVDTIDTGGGRDRVDTGESGLPDDDIVTTGDGPDEVVLRGGVGGAGSIDLGTGSRGLLTLRDTAPAAWFVDNRRDVLTTDGVGEPLTGLTGLHTEHLHRTSLTFLGSEADEHVEVVGPDNAQNGPVHLAMGGGVDTVDAWWRWYGDIDLGRGEGHLVVSGNLVRGYQRTGGQLAKRADVHLDGTPSHLVRHPLTLRHVHRVTVHDVLDVHVVGSGRQDRVSVRGCSVTARLGGGADRFGFHDAGGQCALDHQPATAHVYGERGDDVLRGSATDDVLLGGAGRDVVHGGGGHDRCQAEVSSDC